ncbi:MAG: uracil-DNA glycosylase [Chloroflexi bacterium]|nr:uracil-DNA glycosylase [Chloroflexota bacterium]
MTTSLDRYLSALAARPNSPVVTNPYRGPFGDVRLANLHHYLEFAADRGGVLLVGEAPGYRGCAVTGIPFTSRHLLASQIGRWSLFSDLGFAADPSLGVPEREVTATVVWRHVPRCLAAPPLAGNAFPFHPHPAGQPQRNRPLTAPELEEGCTYLRLLLDAFPAATAIAIGRQAAHALRRLAVEPVSVLRHPSHGGAPAFAAGLRAAMNAVGGG